MSDYRSYIKRYWSIDVKTIWNDIFGKVDRDLFEVNGSQIYYGYQGEGKTLSMYYHFTKVKNNFPKTIVVSNLRLLKKTPIPIKAVKEKVLEIQENYSEIMENYSKEDSIYATEDEEFKVTPFHLFYESKKFEFWEDHYIEYSTHDDLIWLLRNVRSGKYGVIFLIDEIHNYFHSHDSKSMPMWVVQVFSQQRKQRILILGTAQSWKDVIKAIRDQIRNLVKCSRLFFVIRQYAADPRDIENEYGEEVLPEWRAKGFFFQNKEMREGFDTLQVIDSGRHVMGGNEMTVNVRNIDSDKPKKKSRLR